MIPNINPSQVYPNVGSVVPQSLASASADTGGTYLTVPPGTKWMHLRLSCGAGAGSVAVTANQATSAAGAGTKALTLNPTITGILTASKVTLYDQNLDLILDYTNGFRFIQVVCTTTGTLIVGLDVAFGPNFQMG